MLLRSYADEVFKKMDTFTCPNCDTQLPQHADVIKFETGGARYQESEHCCPNCQAVVSVEVTMAEDDAPTMSRLMAIEI